jgi:ankyrin repeat protein
LSAVVRANNFDGLLTIIDLGVDIQAVMKSGSYGIDSFDLAVKFGFFHMLKLMDTFARDELTSSLRSPSPIQSYPGVTYSGVQVCQLANAAAVGRIAILKFIAARLGNLDRQEVVRAIGMAFKNRHLDTVERLIGDTEESILRSNIQEILMLGVMTGPLVILERLLPYMSELTDVVNVIELATLHGNIELARFLLGYQLGRNSDISLGRVFVAAIRGGQLEFAGFVKSLDVPLHFGDLFPAISSAIVIGNLAGLRLIFEGLTPTEQGNCAGRAIPISIEYLQNEITSYLISFNPHSSNCLLAAVKSKSIEVVTKLLEIDHSPEFVNQISSEGTALCAAAAIGHLEILKLLLSIPGINADLYNEFHETPLIIACRFKHFEIVKSLIDFYGDRLHRESAQLNNALLWAFRSTERATPEYFDTYNLRSPDLDQIPLDPRILVNHGQLDTALTDLAFEVFPFFMRLPNIDINYYAKGETILIIAARTRNYQLMKQILEVPNCDPNLYDRGGNTAIIHSASEGHLDCLKLLMCCPRTDINHRNFQTVSAFVVAAVRGFKDILRCLLSDPKFDSLKSNVGMALAFVASVADLRDIVAILIAIDFDINARVRLWRFSNFRIWKGKGFTPLVAAVLQRCQPLIAQIIAHPRFDAARSCATQAIFASVKLADVQLFQLLLPLVGNDVNIRSSKNEGLLVFACLRGSVGIVREIVGAPTFDPLRNDMNQAVAEAIRSDIGVVISLLAPLPSVDLNQKFGMGVNGHRSRVDANFGEAEREEEEEQFYFMELPIGVPPIIAAARMSRIDALSSLLAQPGIDMNARGEFGQTLLFEIPNDGLCLNALMNSDELDMKARDIEGKSALFHAFHRQDWVLMIALVRKGIDLNLRSVHGVLFVFSRPLGNTPTR